MLVMQGIEKVKFRSGGGKGAPFTPDIEDLVKKLCKKEPSERLPMRHGGSANLRQHKWLATFDWKALVDRSLGVPYTPMVRSPKDLGNFHAHEEDKPKQIHYHDNGGGWDADFATI